MIFKNKIYRTVIFLSLLIVLSGCSLVAPKYTASIENIEKLKSSNVGVVDVSNGTVAKESLNVIGMRGSSMHSPYSSYGQYLSEAIKQEFSIAGKFKQGSEIMVFTQLLENDIDTSVAYGEIKALVEVKNKSEVIYSQDISIRLEWPANFAGAIAIPKAQQQYPIMVKKLLNSLYSDERFIKAIQ